MQHDIAIVRLGGRAVGEGLIHVPTLVCITRAWLSISPLEFHATARFGEHDVIMMMQLVCAKMAVAVCTQPGWAVAGAWRLAILEWVWIVVEMCEASVLTMVDRISAARKHVTPVEATIKVVLNARRQKPIVIGRCAREIAVKDANATLGETLVRAKDAFVYKPV